MGGRPEAGGRGLIDDPDSAHRVAITPLRCPREKVWRFSSGRAGSEHRIENREVVKRRLYERFGVAEYWVVDPEIEVVKVYRREGEAFQRLGELSAEGGDELTTELLPGLEISLVALLSR